MYIYIYIYIYKDHICLHILYFYLYSILVNMQLNIIKFIQKTKLNMYYIF